MQDRFVLQRLEQLRALADPLRLRLVEALVRGEHSVASLSRTVGAPVTRLYHHVDLLLEAGLITITRRAKRRGVEERFYRAAARNYVMDRGLLEMSPDRGQSIESLVDLAQSILGGALELLTEGLRAGRIVPGRNGPGMVIENRVLRLSPAGFAALARELPAWLDDFARRHGSLRGAEHQLALAAFPGGGVPGQAAASNAPRPKKKQARALSRSR